MKSKSNKYKVFKCILGLVFIVFFIIILIKIIPLFTNIVTEEGRMELKSKIQNLGLKGALIIVGLMIAQIFFIFLPGEPVEILAGMCYGSLGGLLVIYAGSFISGLLIILLVRFLGKNFVYTFVPENKIEKLKNSKLLNSKKTTSVLILLFAVPGSPKDLLTYVGAMLPINPIKFITISTLARFPSIISSTIVGNNLLQGNWLFIISTYLITFLISGVILYLYNKKENTSENINEIMRMSK